MTSKTTKQDLNDLRFKQIAKENGEMNKLLKALVKSVGELNTKVALTNKDLESNTKVTEELKDSQKGIKKTVDEMEKSMTSMQADIKALKEDKESTKDLRKGVINLFGWWKITLAIIAFFGAICGVVVGVIKIAQHFGWF